MTRTLRLILTRTDTGEQLDTTFEVRRLVAGKLGLVLAGPEAREALDKLSVFLEPPREETRVLPAFYLVQLDDGVPFQAVLSHFKVDVLAAEPAFHVRVQFLDVAPPRIPVDLPPENRPDPVEDRPSVPEGQT